MANNADQPQSPSALTAQLAAAIHDDHFPTSDRAALKRMTPEGKRPLAFHRFVIRYVPEPWLGGHFDTAWQTLIAGLALQPAHPHDSQRPLGRALADIGLSEDRLERLLAAEGTVLHTLALRAARRLATHQARANWNDYARLLFAPNDEAREQINTRIARDYYREPAKQSETV